METRDVEAPPRLRRPSSLRPAASLLAALMALLLAGCDSHEEELPPDMTPTVTVQPPVRQQVTDWDEFTGRVVPTERVELRARVSGYLDTIAFTDGQIVRRGDLLFRIDRRPFEAAVTEAEARLTAARSQVTLSEREFARATNLLQYRAGSEANLEQRTQALEAARAAVVQADASLQRARLDLEFTEIRAPQAGRIGRHLVSPGNLVSGGEASNATLLAVIVTMDPIDVSFDIDQAAALRYARLAERGGRPSSRDMANPVQLALADETGFPHTGRVVFVDNEADAGTGTIRLRARFANPRDLLLPGVFARIRLVASAPYQALLLPEAAIATDQSRRIVYVLAPGDMLEMRPVELGPLHDGMRVIRTGLKGDEEIVVTGLTRARAGQVVAPRRAAAPDPQPEARR
ncbi:efflux RND transporter periplasmic adaptor subunit [Belnapia rosea]|uniref:RND family efflux transporter, MFP subunit n=1 Tax=Belnapia rosea TaxID=938405 RepID=A0A1G6ZE20_9PROT|nr:efflux RND transporter periplasmic adaptor subunit [Belnapia rosea]SDB34317.1 RND family efflux transporter, MFP subunit [Belnapia rosea]SDE00732.1 RND family efflux transporter, MFP subunit [Belnapia rosea]